MTCIVGIVDGSRVLLGGDSAAVAGWMHREPTHPKVFQTGPFLIGYTSSYRMGQILQYHLEVPKQEDRDDMAFMVRSFVPAAREALKAHGFTEIEKNKESGGQFLVGYKESLYQIESDFQVHCPKDEIAAVGCGAEFALGALKVLVDRQEYGTEEMMREALSVASYFSIGVQFPYTILELEKFGA